MKFIAGR